MKPLLYAFAFCFFCTATFAQVTKKPLELPEFKGIYVNFRFNRLSLNINIHTSVSVYSKVQVLERWRFEATRPRSMQ